MLNLRAGGIYGSIWHQQSPHITAAVSHAESKDKHTGGNQSMPQWTPKQHVLPREAMTLLSTQSHKHTMSKPITSLA